MLVRLDKYLADAGFGSRSQVKNMLRRGRVTVDGAAEKSPERKIETDSADVCVDGMAVLSERTVWFMMNKPSGYITASSDKSQKVVMDLMKPYLAAGSRQKVSPVGRLDIDTEGLLLLTDDGQAAHRLLSPSHHVPKTYQAVLEGKIDKTQVEKFETGLDIGDEKITKPARLEILCETPLVTFAEITVTEGRYHQVKRMAEKIGSRVLYLRRISMGGIKLDLTLPWGGVRKLAADELDMLTHSLNSLK